MTSELEQEFYKTFGIEPKYKICIFKYCKNKKEYDCENCNDRIWHYPKITDHKLLQLLCIYNDMQGYIDDCLTPRKYEDVKEMILSTLVNEKLAMIDCEKDTYMDIMTKQIQQLFKEEE